MINYLILIVKTTEFFFCSIKRQLLCYNLSIFNYSQEKKSVALLNFFFLFNYFLLSFNRPRIVFYNIFFCFF